MLCKVFRCFCGKQVKRCGKAYQGAKQVLKKPLLYGQDENEQKLYC